MSRRLIWIALLAYLVALALIAYWPTPVDRPADGQLFAVIRWLDAHGITLVTYDRIEFAANVALFVPFGLLLAGLLRRGRRWIALLICIAGSAAIEIGQGLFLPDRFASLGDVLANSLGAAIGVLVVWLISRRTASIRSRREVKNP
ncbi:VanZ family protein [Pseudolysinimonas sp.]|uniref:VanZ family protein n=1 Tax=Pseudolysinimonas sp. TaxID=2680009 RepID=UPI003F802F9A